jgi:hypothetical protein
MSRERLEPPSPKETDVVDLVKVRRIREFAAAAERTLFDSDSAMVSVVHRLRSGAVSGAEAAREVTEAAFAAYTALGGAYRTHTGVSAKEWDRALHTPNRIE